VAPSASNLLTQTSVQAQVIADTFRSAFAAKKLGDCTVEMTSPTDSTRGGILAMQHITLKGTTGLSLVIGRVNAVEKKATMRTYYAVGRLFQDRFKKAPPFEQPAYDEMVTTAKSLLTAFGVEVELTDSTGQEPGLDLTRGYKAPTYDEASGRKIWPWVAGIVVLALGLAVLVYVLASPGTATPTDAPAGSVSAPADSTVAP
jgi:hypothetical protein